MKVDYLIVGQGLAGTVLSYQLIKAKKKVVVINQTNRKSSSHVAAGLYNPITGRRMVKTWLADELFPYLEAFYSDMEQVLETRILMKSGIYRPFLSIEEQNEWMAKSADPMFSDYLEGIVQSSSQLGIKDPYGGLALKYSGYLDVSLMLDQYKRYLLENEAYIESAFDENMLVVNQEDVSYEGITANKIIFCAGVNDASGRFFNWLPFNPVKGDIISIKSEIPINKIINRGVYIIPQGNGTCRAGSTYSWDDLTDVATEKGKSEMMRKIEELIDSPYQVEDHQVGVRPATDDRRPFIGQHPALKPLYIFNGLGTKGVSLAPYFALEFLAYLEGRKELHEEVNINRYFSLY